MILHHNMVSPQMVTPRAGSPPPPPPPAHPSDASELNVRVRNQKNHFRHLKNFLCEHLDVRRNSDGMVTLTLTASV